MNTVKLLALAALPTVVLASLAACASDNFANGQGDGPPAEPRHPFPQTEGRPKGLNILGTFAHHPELTRAYNTFNGHILFGTTLDLRTPTLS